MPAFLTLADVTRDADLRRWADDVAARESGLDVLVNNAGILGKRAAFQHLTSEDWTAVLVTNVAGPILATRAFLPLLRRGLEPLVINIGSVAGRFPRAGLSMYCASKAGLSIASGCLAQELTNDRIRVIEVVPSRVSTALRRTGYGEEPPHPEVNLANLLSTVERLVRERGQIASGSCFACDDIGFW